MHRLQQTTTLVKTEDLEPARADYEALPIGEALPTFSLQHETIASMPWSRWMAVCAIIRQWLMQREMFTLSR